MMDHSRNKLYRLCSQAEWETCELVGFIPYNKDDSRDGFLHLSVAGQVKGTALKHYAEVENLYLLGLSLAAVKPILRVEPSTHGELFPHAYGQVPVSAILFARPVPQQNGKYQFPPALFA